LWSYFQSRLLMESSAPFSPLVSLLRRRYVDRGGKTWEKITTDRFRRCNDAKDHHIDPIICEVQQEGYLRVPTSTKSRKTNCDSPKAIHVTDHSLETNPADPFGGNRAGRKIRPITSQGWSWMRLLYLMKLQEQFHPYHNPFRKKANSWNWVYCEMPLSERKLVLVEIGTIPRLDESGSNNSLQQFSQLVQQTVPVDSVSFAKGLNWSSSIERRISPTLYSP